MAIAMPVWRIRFGSPRQSLRVDILADVRQLAISNSDGENPVIHPNLAGGFYCSLRRADDQNPVALRYVFGSTGKDVSSSFEAV